MTQTTFTDNVLIDGSQDTTQLDVQGHSTQNDPLQTWKNSAGDTLAQVTGDGRFTVGDDLGMSTPDALIEVHRDSTSTSKPTRGLNTLGRVASALSTAVQWVFAALELVGTGTISSIHSALRAQLTHSSTGDSSAAELRAGDFEVINESGSSGTPVGKAVGIRAVITNEADGFLTDAVGVEISLENENTETSPIETAYGLKVNDIEEADTNYALYTGAGKVRFGDQMVVGNQAAPDASAILELVSTTQGLLIPRMTTTQRDAISSPGNGLLIYNTTTNRFNLRQNGAWIELAEAVHNHQNTAGGGQLNAGSVFSAGALPLARGGTNADLSASGGTGQVVKQGSLGGALSVAALTASEIPDLNASKITSGTLIHERGGLEANVAAYNGLVKVSGGATSQVTAPTGAIVGTTDAQAISGKTRIQSTKYYTYSNNIDDDSVITVEVGTAYGGLVELIGNVASVPRGRIWFRTASLTTPVIDSSVGNLAVSSSVLNGTTGTDGYLTFSANSNGNLYIENRTGVTIAVTLIVFAA